MVDVPPRPGRARGQQGRRVLGLLRGHRRTLPRPITCTDDTGGSTSALNGTPSVSTLGVPLAASSWHIGPVLRAGRTTRPRPELLSAAAIVLLVALLATGALTEGAVVVVLGAAASTAVLRAAGVA